MSKSPIQFSRPLGDSELSYFLPSRADGVNDMYLHLGFRAPPTLLSPHRVCMAWSILRGRHPLLAAHVVMKPLAYTEARFVYTAPASVQDALADAQANFEVRTSTKDALIDSYLNGPRTLSNERISYLVLSSPPPTTLTPPASPALDKSEAEAAAPAADPEPQEFDFLICAAHFLGDGMALHTFANDLFLLLTGEQYADDAALAALHSSEWTSRWGSGANDKTEEHGERLPAALEARLPRALHAFQRVAHEIEFQCAQARLIGGHAFRRAAQPAPRRTVVPTVSFDPETTRAALAACKKHGVSIAHALFALCNVVWARVGGGRPELPMLMYSALNLRPYLAPPPDPHPHPSYWFLAVGYFSVVLPSFLPSTHPHHATFWARARAAKAQSTRAAKAPLLLPRARCMAQERGARARTFARADDDAPPVTPPTPVPSPSPAAARSGGGAAKPASTALVGLSLLGNLDGMYAHKAYGAHVVLHTLTTGSRQRAGGMLLFGYTFAGRLWLCFGYDCAAYEGELVRRWWDGVCMGVREFLVGAA